MNYKTKTVIEADNMNTVSNRRIYLKSLAVTKSKLFKYKRGFTLVELMVVLAIVSILTAIGVPSYRSYVIRNAEAEAQSQMQLVEVELSNWRASALSYRGFEPKIDVDAQNNPVYGYADDANTFIYIPKGSNANNYSYRLKIVDGTDRAKSLVPTDSNSVSNATGRSWVMFAVPNPNTDGWIHNADKILMTSTGLKCKGNASSSISITSTKCDTDMESW